MEIREFCVPKNAMVSSFHKDVVYAKATDEPQIADLYEQIGKLNMRLEWLKKLRENGL